ncbi:MAG: phosphoribosylglycinamide formyltransferase [Bacteroidia bacterium]
MKKICVFASGNGSNAEKIIRYFRDRHDACVALVVTNNPRAGVIEKARNLGIPVYCCSMEELKSSEGLCVRLSHEKMDLLVLAGFLRLIPPALLKAFPDRIINIHPALLPKFGGKGMHGIHVHQAVIDAGEKESGITIHRVNEHYDEGAILLQKTCPVLPGDSAEDLARRVLDLEHRYYPSLIGTLVGST